MYGYAPWSIQVWHRRFLFRPARLGTARARSGRSVRGEARPLGRRARIPGGSRPSEPEVKKGLLQRTEAQRKLGHLRQVTTK